MHPASRGGPASLINERRLPKELDGFAKLPTRLDHWSAGRCGWLIGLSLDLAVAFRMNRVKETTWVYSTT
jgi:hypothetical protein